jgi:hypothetical protein
MNLAMLLGEVEVEVGSIVLGMILTGPFGDRIFFPLALWNKRAEMRAFAILTVGSVAWPYCFSSIWQRSSGCCSS